MLDIIEVVELVRASSNNQIPEEDPKTQIEEKKPKEAEIKKEEEIISIKGKDNKIDNGNLDPEKLSSVSYKLSSHAYISMTCEPKSPPTFKTMVKTILVTNLQNEGKKLIPNAKLALDTVKENDKEYKKEGVSQMFINHLLRPENWSKNNENQFMFRIEDILKLINECSLVVKSQPIVLRVKVPVKVFGDFHGQYQDLMRFFELWRAPVEAARGGDIESYDYLFLGDYIDRGAYSLETICLLMALKVKFPNRIHLLRGNHEDICINQVFGFAEECEERLDDDVNDDFSIFKTINRFFDWLPLAGIIENRILCLHGGIGRKLNNISDLEGIKRPLEINQDVKNDQAQILIDVLWSDPTDTDNDYGIQNDKARDPYETGYIVQYGPDRYNVFVCNVFK